MGAGGTMAGRLENRVEQRFREIEERLRGHGVGIPQDKLVPTNYIDEKINNYEYYLNKAYENAVDKRASQAGIEFL